MSDEPRMPVPRPSERRRSQGLFNTAMGPLQRQLHLGEYNLLKFSPMFESDFVQISKRGGAVDVHNQVQLVRVAIAATSPSLQIPNVLLLARPVFPARERRLAPQARIRRNPRIVFELTRLLPLCFVKISVHDREKQQLRFKLVSGRTFYLQLCPQQDARDDVFESWVKITHLLRPPSELKHKLREPDGEMLEQEAPQQPEDSAQRSVEPLGLVDKENPNAESTLQEEMKEKNDDPAEPSQEPAREPFEEQQSIQEDTSSSTSPTSQGETTEEEKAPLSEDQDSEEQLKGTSAESTEWRLKTRRSTSRKTTKRSRSHRSHSSKKAASYSRLTSLLIKPFSNPKKKGKKL